MPFVPYDMSDVRCTLFSVVAELLVLKCCYNGSSMHWHISRVDACEIDGLCFSLIFYSFKS